MSVSAEAEAEAPRARPLSGGLWTLFSWLRRDDSSSSESLSSAGSDRTAVSFAFLASPPPHPRAQAAPLPPPSPPSDTYKKRVRDRNLRRQHDRNLTLHSKYGLYRCDGSYDAFSLPFTRRSGDLDDRQERERRASSECGQLRAAYVPGKRRAPPPPAAASPPLTRRRTRKRPAPLPPVKFKHPSKENESSEQDKANIIVQMNSKSNPDRRPLSTSDVPMGCKSEKYSKKEINAKDTKPRTEKSFLKQMFENRKRNSAVESFPGKILPSISELDKQAAQIIESCKLRELEPNNDYGLRGSPSSENTWFCTRCLRKYKPTVVTCQYCLPEQQKLVSGVYDSVTKAANASSIYTQTMNETSPNEAATNRLSGVGMDEKKKLKEMLKEMKDSLPKRPKHEKGDRVHGKNMATTVDKSGKQDVEDAVLETPTLRIGSVIRPENNVSPSTSLQISAKPKDLITKQDSINNVKSNSATETVIITQPVVLVAPLLKNNLPVINNSRTNRESVSAKPSTSLVNKDAKSTTPPKVTLSERPTEDNEFNDLNGIVNEKINIHTPLKISSLFNPVYIPKSSLSEVQLPKSIFFSQVNNKASQIQAKNEIKPIVPMTKNEVQLASPSASTSLPTASQSDLSKASPKSLKTNIKDENEMLTKDKQMPSLNTVEVPDKSVIHEKEVTTVPDTILMHKNDLPAIPVTIQSPPAQKNNPSDALPVNSSSNLQSLNVQRPSNSNIVRLSAEQHSRRRDLINQLEQSISRGDERAAAEAAVKLAQLKLSCSVLSFSSQIVGESSKEASQSSEYITKNKPDDSKSPTPLVQSKTTPDLERNLNINKTIDPKPKTPIQQPQSSTPKIIIPTDKAHDSKAKTSAPSTKVNTSVQSMEIVSSKDKCKQNKEKGISIKNEVNISSTAKQQVPKNEPNDINAQKPESVQPSTSKLTTHDNLASIEVWVEDREATRGPVRLQIARQAMMGELRRQAEATLGLAASMQRWIIGHALCTNDNTALVSLAGPDLAAPFYLCLVQSDTNAESSGVKVDTTEVDNDKTGNVYSELVQLEQRALVPNAEAFECGVCMEECAAGGGAVLRDCVHAFCRQCISDLVRHCEEPTVSCPAMGCPGVLQEREIRAVVSAEEYEKWLARGLAAAESGTRNAFHCRTRDCTGWALCEPGVRRFPCPVCKHTNCVPCKAIHEGETCEQHRLKLLEAANSKTLDASHTDEGTKALLDTLITKGEALQCPECSAIITKKWGCDWVKCSACKTEICWVTRGRRWGPGGRGDTTGGCRCGVDGKRCHPLCGYCH